MAEVYVQPVGVGARLSAAVGVQRRARVQLEACGHVLRHRVEAVGECGGQLFLEGRQPADRAEGAVLVERVGGQRLGGSREALLLGEEVAHLVEQLVAGAAPQVLADGDGVRRRHVVCRRRRLAPQPPHRVDEPAEQRDQPRVGAARAHEEELGGGAQRLRRLEKGRHLLGLQAEGARKVVRPAREPSQVADQVYHQLERGRDLRQHELRDGAGGGVGRLQRTRQLGLAELVRQHVADARRRGAVREQCEQLLRHCRRPIGRVEVRLGPHLLPQPRQLCVEGASRLGPRLPRHLERRRRALREGFTAKEGESERLDLLPRPRELAGPKAEQQRARLVLLPRAVGQGDAGGTARRDDQSERVQRGCERRAEQRRRLVPKVERGKVGEREEAE
mmetsp:Transcript_34677/g.114898  ORF Transcript_34677/g.114898 Transcript_34677/m.114898 type:complete len:391 (-) Transcript_34677:611-1783(-)